MKIILIIVSKSHHVGNTAVRDVLNTEETALIIPIQNIKFRLLRNDF